MDKLILKKKGPILLFLFQMILLVPHISTLASPSLFAYNTKWCPNPSFDGGLNTVIVLDRFFDFEAIYLQNHTFYAKYNGSTYWLNVTSGSDVVIRLQNWFDLFGTLFSVNKPCEINLYVGDKGESSKVNGEVSSVYYSGNKSYTLTFSQASYCGLHWLTGSTVHMKRDNVDTFWCHSHLSYQTCYGFGVLRGGYKQYSFLSRTYAEHGREDIEEITLQLGENVAFTYSESTHRMTLHDPDHWCQIADEWYPEKTGSAWVNYDNSTHYLDVAFLVYFRLEEGNETIPEYWITKYQPRMVNQNVNVTCKSTVEGDRISSFPSVFYVGVSGLANLPPIYIPWGISYLVIGLGGLFLLIVGPLYGAKRIKSGDVPEGIMFGVVLSIIAIGLIIVWLWR